MAKGLAIKSQAKNNSKQFKEIQPRNSRKII